MITNNEHLQRAQQGIQRLYDFLADARERYPAEVYERMATAYLIDLQERQAEVNEYLGRGRDTIAEAS